MVHKKKHRFLEKMIVLTLILCVFLTSCGLFETKSNRTDENGEMVSAFVIIETTKAWKIVYHRDTRVMYGVSSGIHGSGVFSPLYNQDGTLMIWEE